MWRTVSREKLKEGERNFEVAARDLLRGVGHSSGPKGETFESDSP